MNWSLADVPVREPFQVYWCIYSAPCIYTVKKSEISDYFFVESIVQVVSILTYLYLAHDTTPIKIDRKNWQILQVPVTSTCGTRLNTQIRKKLEPPMTWTRKWLYPRVFPRINSWILTSLHDSCSALYYKIENKTKQGE